MTVDIRKRNNVRELGNGSQPMMFAHGFGCDQGMWRFVAPAFEDRYRVILFDYVGSGKSDRSSYDGDRYSTLDGYARDVIEIIEALDLRDVVFVGHSVSSMIGALASIEIPDRFARLIMVGPSPSYLNDGEYKGGFEREEIEGLLEMMERNFLGWANFLAPVIMKNEGRSDLTSELEESFCSMDPAVAREFARATFFSDNRNDLPRITIPSLVMQCSEDSIAPDSVGEYVSGNIPSSTLVRLKATGHCPHMSHPDETIDVIGNYLGS